MTSEAGTSRQTDLDDDNDDLDDNENDNDDNSNNNDNNNPKNDQKSDMIARERQDTRDIPGSTSAIRLYRHSDSDIRLDHFRMAGRVATSPSLAGDTVTTGQAAMLIEGRRFWQSRAAPDPQDAFSTCTPSSRLALSECPSSPASQSPAPQSRVRRASLPSQETKSREIFFPGYPDRPGLLPPREVAADARVLDLLYLRQLDKAEPYKRHVWEKWIPQTSITPRDHAPVKESRAGQRDERDERYERGRRDERDQMDQKGQKSQSPRDEDPSLVEERPVRPQDAALLGISSETHDDTHPVYAELLRAIGHLHLTEDTISELSLERDTILEDLHLSILLERSRKGMLYMSEEDLEQLKADIFAQRPELVADKFASLLDTQNAHFLRHVDTSLQHAQDRLAEQRQTAQSLVERCLEQCAFRHDIPYNEKYAIHDVSGQSQEQDLDQYLGRDLDQDEGETMVEDTMLEDAMDSVPSPRMLSAQNLSHPFLPLLLSSPRHLLAEQPMTAKVSLKQVLGLPKASEERRAREEESIKEYGIDTILMRFEEGNKADFINRWLLQRMRTTPLEAEHLYSCFSRRLKVLNVQRWQADVLYFWGRDGSNTGSLAQTATAWTSDSMSVRISNDGAMDTGAEDTGAGDLGSPEPGHPEPGHTEDTRNILSIP